MRNNAVRERLARGETVIGPMIMDCIGPGLPQILAGAGADFIIYDQEAGCLDIATIKMQAALCRGLNVVPLVNVPWHDYHLLVRPLDSGAMGLVLPVVQTGAEAQEIVRITHYPPAGVRGVAFGIAHDDYGATDIDAAIRIADARTLIVVKIETVAGLENVDAIVAVPGVDVAYVGHMDLSVSLGIAGQYDHPRFQEAVDRILDACRRHGKAAGAMATTPDAAMRWMARGIRFLIYATDVLLLASAFRAGAMAVRAR